MKISSRNPLKIGGYSIDTMPKAKNMEFELQRIILKKFAARNCFDWRGLHDKMRKQFLHIHHLEDLWIDVRTEVDIWCMDYIRLTVNQIVDFNFASIPPSFEDDDQIINPEYFQHDVEKIPILPPTWSCKENTSIWDRF